MEINEFKERADDLLSQLEDLIHELPQKGNSSTECQRMNLQQCLNELSYAVNGTEAEDLVEDPEED